MILAVQVVTKSLSPENFRFGLSPEKIPRISLKGQGHLSPVCSAEQPKTV